jgi:hypothetical protein
VFNTFTIRTIPSDPHQVWLTLDGKIRDENFLKFLERVCQETLDTLDPHDFLILGLIASGKRLPADLQPHVPRLLELGILDRMGHGKPILSKRLYSSAGKAGARARARDEAREPNKTLMLKHLESNRSAGTAMEDLIAAFPMLSRSTLKRLLDELRKEDRVHAKGMKRNTRASARPQLRTLPKFIIR